MKNRKFRPALAAALVVAFFAVLFMFPSVQAAAKNFLGLFRVQQIQVIEFNPANLPENLEASMTDFMQVFSDDVEFAQSGTPVEVASAAEASSLAGYAVKMPASGKGQISFQPASIAMFQVDRDLWQSLLDDLGQSDISLPKAIDGETITIEMPNSVTYTSGDCATPAMDGHPSAFFGSSCTLLVQMPSPSIEAPAGLPIQKVGETFLQIFGMSAEEAESFSARIDWSTTLVVPVPLGADYIETTVNGYAATLFSSDYGRMASHSVIWLENGMLYSLSVTGDATADDVVLMAETLK